MNRSLLLAAVILSCATLVVSAQTPPANSNSQEQLLALVKEVRTQQTTLAANETQIDEKLAAIAEAIRQARIYSSRAGR